MKSAAKESSCHYDNSSYAVATKASAYGHALFAPGYTFLKESTQWAQFSQYFLAFVICRVRFDFLAKYRGKER